MASTINILNKKKNIYKQKNKQTKKQTNKKTNKKQKNSVRTPYFKNANTPNKQ